MIPVDNVLKLKTAGFVQTTTSFGPPFGLVSPGAMKGLGTRVELKGDASVAVPLHVKLKPLADLLKLSTTK